ncbi:D-alanyl-D-alanine carboxypeptidase [Streptomyces sp. H10-C2]|uniref:D-alanyl-D-alanine carboxypeptidase family protein n=1 Tax=unclassified Streptomyces TaxID=2593676 RepID=UPI0024BB17D9|nr:MULTISPECIES: serine hydrolase [unclassified Streptomyces]MDJ0343017.1 D-alanyl-D-alanine carboxypeptidase [Streptomyces sp. PH10-H1]MDJ0371423.1 D-alanyl-D-alanine carboxypeptidase [Streptomyces sp. H10-C2]
MTASGPARTPSLWSRVTVLTAVCLTVSCPAVPALANGDDGPAPRPAPARAVAAGVALKSPGLHVLPRDGSPEPPDDLSALSWVVADARTGEVLAAKDAHLRLPPASTLKTLFAITVLPRFPQETNHIVSDAELEGIGEGSSRVGVQAGQTYTVADLWRGVFLSSGNDAVHVLARMNGSVSLTVAQMQAKAEMLGADDTEVISPDGYDAPGQVSSAYDLTLFARAGLASPYFTGYTSTATAMFPGGEDPRGHAMPPFQIQNTNRLLTGADGLGRYPGLIGVKNGYTTNAGNTLITAARRGDRTLIATVMNPQSGQPQAVYREARALLDWGFAAAGRTGSVGTLNTATRASAPRVRPTAAALAPVMTAVPAPDTGLSWIGWSAAGGAALAATAGTVFARRRYLRAR